MAYELSVVAITSDQRSTCIVVRIVRQLANAHAELGRTESGSEHVVELFKDYSLLSSLREWLGVAGATFLCCRPVILLLVWRHYGVGGRCRSLRPLIYMYVGFRRNTTPTLL